MAVDRFTVSDLIILSGYVAFFLEVFWANLRNMHINHVGVMTINLHQLLLIIAVHIDIVTGADVLMWEDILGFAVLVAWGLHVPHLQIAGLFLLVDLEKEVLLCDNFFIGLLSKFFSSNLIFEFNQTYLLLNNHVDALPNLAQVMRTGFFAQLLVSSRHGGVGFKSGEVVSFTLSLSGVLLGNHLRILPECLNISWSV